MKAVFVVLAVAALAAAPLASAECANACSGHGNCATKDQCECYPNWQAADCSERTCPFGLSFVDTPQGDLNHDGTVDLAHHGVAVQWNTKNTWEQFPIVYNTEYVATDQEAHFYAECSNKGLCDRETGLCQCFDGYTGSSCQRTECPNDCSGHGVCRTVEEIATGAMNYAILSRDADHTKTAGVSTAFSYDLWDSDKNQGCVCDPGYSGTDCSMRECPRGDDPLTHLNKDCGGAACVDETQTIVFDMSADTDSISDAVISFTDWDQKTWTTDTFTITGDNAGVTADATAAVVQAALRAIPNGVLEEVTVTATANAAGYTDSFHITIAFGGTDVGRSGNLAAITGSSVSGDADLVAVVVTEATAGTTEEVTCSYRGLCDYETGLCQCFKGYYDDDCSQQSTLAL